MPDSMDKDNPKPTGSTTKRVTLSSPENDFLPLEPRGPERRTLTSPPNHILRVGIPPDQEKSQTPENRSPQRSSAFQTMFGNVSIPKEYQDYKELRKDKKLTWAQEIHVHNQLRSEQIALLDKIKKDLLADQKNDDQEHARIFYRVLRTMKANLRHEIRWTALLGISTHSRLEDIIDKHIKDLEANPALGNLIKPEAISKEGLDKLVKDPGLMNDIRQLIEPKSFINRAMGLIKDLGDSVKAKMHKKPKH